MPLPFVCKDADAIDESTEVLLLYSQKLDEIPERLREPTSDMLGKLVQLTLSFNRLSGDALTTIAAPLPLLTHLDVSHNQLETLRGIEVRFV